MQGSGFKVAPLWRRLAAVAVNAAVFVTPTIAAVVGIAGLYARLSRRRGQKGDDWSVPKPARLWRLAFSALSIAIEIRTRNWRSPGYRALGLRRVDVRTGGPVSIQSVLIGSAARTSLNQSVQRLARPWQERHRERLSVAQGELDELRAAHAADPQAMERDLRDVYERQNVNPVTGCLPVLVPPLLVDLWAVFSPLHQTLFERLAGTVVVED
jgi:uncharacterized RDD family membrane protein YckC